MTFIFRESEVRPPRPRREGTLSVRLSGTVLGEPAALLTGAVRQDSPLISPVAGSRVSPSLEAEQSEVMK